MLFPICFINVDKNYRIALFSLLLYFKDIKTETQNEDLIKLIDEVLVEIFFTDTDTDTSKNDNKISLIAKNPNMNKVISEIKKYNKTKTKVFFLNYNIYFKIIQWLIDVINQNYMNEEIQDLFNIS